jgi:hypothetical protein
MAELDKTLRRILHHPFARSKQRAEAFVGAFAFASDAARLRYCFAKKQKKVMD